MAEENPQNLVLLAEAFMAEKLDVEIDAVSDGDQLLTRLAALSSEECTYGLVLLDIDLPRRSAEEVLIALNLQQRRLGIPLVVLTNLISEVDKRRLVSLGVRAILTKPFDMSEYFALARTLFSLMRF